MQNRWGLGVLCSTMLLILAVIVFPKEQAQAAAIVWNGAGDDTTCGGGVGDGNKWSCGANWVGGVAPGSADLATFNATSVKNATIDSVISVGGITMNAGYTGIITQATGVTVTIGSQNFVTSAGTFTGGDSAITLNGAMTVSGGTFNSTSGTLTITGALTVSSGTLNTSVGTVMATSTAATWNINVSQTFQHLTVSKTGGAALTITAGDIFVVTGTLTLTDGLVNTGTIDTRSNISQASTFDGGTTIIDFGDDVVAQTYTLNGGVAPTIRLDSAADAADNIAFAAVTTITNLTVSATFSGTIPITNATDVAMTVTTWSQSAGTFNGTGFSSLILRNLTLTSAATFNAPTTVTSTGTGTWDVNVTQSVNNFTITAGTLTISAGDTIVTTGALTLTDGTVNTGTIDARTSITQGALFDGGTGNIDFGDNAVAQTYTLNGGTSPTIRLDSPSDTSDVINFAAAATISGLTVTSGFSGAIPITNASAFAMTFGSWSQSGGTFNGDSFAAMTITGSLTIASGATFVAPTLVTATGTGGTWNVNVSQTFQNLTINKNFATIMTLVAGDTLLITGTLTLTNGELNSTTGVVEAQGNVVVGSVYGPSSAKLLFSGSAVQSFNLTGGTDRFNPDISVNKSGGKVTLASALVMDAANQDLTLIEGTFSLAGNNLTVNGSTGTFVVQDGGVFERYGAETLTLNASNPTLSSGSTVRYTGDGDAAADTYTITTMVSTYHHLDIASTDGATDIFQLGAALDVNGNLTNSGTLTVTGTNYQVNVAGDWTNTGTFSANTGLVVFDGTDQTVAGTTTFNALTKTVTTNATLTLPALSTQTVNGALTLNGAVGQYLTLRSSATGVQASLEAAGSRSLSYLKVRDNYSTNAVKMNCVPTCINSGNNTNWLFASGSGYTAPTTTSGSSLLIISAPKSGEEVTGGTTYTIRWNTLAKDVDYVDLALSLDGGLNFSVFAKGILNTDSYVWQVPPINTSSAVLKVTTTDLVSAYVSDLSETFTISTADSLTLPATGISPITGQVENITSVMVGDLVRGNASSTVYYIDEGFVRRPFMNAATFFTYYRNFDSVRWVTDATLPLLPLGPQMPPKANTVLVKIQSAPAVYSVGDGGLLRVIADQAMASKLFGSNWADYVIDMDPSVFVNFAVGAPLSGNEIIDRTILLKRETLK